jgi:hypothetical protein
MNYKDFSVFNCDYENCVITVVNIRVLNTYGNSHQQILMGRWKHCSSFNYRNAILRFMYVIILVLRGIFVTNAPQCCSEFFSE